MIQIVDMKPNPFTHPINKSISSTSNKGYGGVEIPSERVLKVPYSHHLVKKIYS